MARRRKVTIPRTRGSVRTQSTSRGSITYRDVSWKPPKHTPVENTRVVTVFALPPGSSQSQGSQTTQKGTVKGGGAGGSHPS